MSEKLFADKRQELGTRACRRLRRAGHIPAVMYGHGEENVNLSLRASEVHAAIRHGSKLVEVTGAVSDSALLRDVQWDAIGTEVVHIDLTRVSAEETVQVELPLELRGEAPGVKEGGIVSHPVHSLTILCPAGAIPDRIQVSINDLRLGQTITASQVTLPANATLVTDPSLVVAQCELAAFEAEEVEAAPGALEPEVIGRKPEREEETED
jgi:large subunit ribosomal protein L25